MRFLFNRTTLQVFVTYLTGALYVHPLWFYKHQHDNRVRSKLSVACQQWWFQWRFWLVPSVPGYTRTLSLETVHTTFEWNCQYGGCFQNLVRNCRWTIVSRQSFWITLYSYIFSNTIPYLYFGVRFLPLWCIILTLTLLTWRIWWVPNNASNWQMGFNLAFKGLNFP